MLFPFFIKNNKKYYLLIHIQGIPDPEFIIFAKSGVHVVEVVGLNVGGNHVEVGILLLKDFEDWILVDF
jgi:hypothetical protein